MEGQTEEIADSTTAGQTEEQTSDNLSPDDLVQIRLGETGEEAPPPEEQEDEQGEPTAEEPEEETEPEIEAGTLSEDELRILESARSRLPKRIAQLTARAKAAEEKIQQLETAQTNPLEAPKPQGENPYRDLKSLEALQAKYTEVNEVIDWAEEVLEDNDGASAEDDVTEVDGKALTKAEVRSALKKARKAKENDLPAQHRELQAAEQRGQFKMQFEKAAKSELDWMDDPESEVNKEYQKIVSDPRIQAMEEAMPDIAPQLPYILAHFANSRFGSGATKPAKIKSAPKPKAPSNQLSSAAASGNPDAGRAKKLADLEKRFNETGSPSDLQALRTLQHTTP